MSGGVSTPSFLPYAIVSLAFGAIFAAGAAAFLWLLFRGPRDGARPDEQPTVSCPASRAPASERGLPARHAACRHRRRRGRAGSSCTRALGTRRTRRWSKIIAIAPDST